MMNPEQYIGQKYNKLTLKEMMSEKDKDGAVLGKFKCASVNDTLLKETYRRMMETKKYQIKAGAGI